MRFPILAVETRSAGFGVAVWAFQCATRLERARSFVDATVMFLERCHTAADSSEEI